MCQDVVDECAGISLIRDESAARLVLRAKCVTSKLGVKCVFLSSVKDPGSGAAAITEATMQGFRRFSTRFLGAPGRSAKAKVKKQFLRKTKDKVRVIATDAAADELLSAAMLKSKTGLMNQEELRALLKNLQLCLRDVSHAARRVVSRGLELGKR